MKKIITLIACVAIAASFSGCGKKTENGAIDESTTQVQNDGTKRIANVGSIEIDDMTYNFFYNSILGQVGDSQKATKYTNEQITGIYNCIEIGKALKLDASAKEQLVSQIKSSYGSDEEYNKFLAENGINQDFIDKFAEAEAYYEAISKYVEENVKNNTDPEQYFKDNYLRAKHVLILTEGVEESEKPEKKKLAEEILERAKSGEDFDKLVEEYSEDPGSKSQPDGYVFPEGQMVDEFWQGTKNIGIGDYNLVESSYGYHVIKRLALDETRELYEKFYKESQVEQQIEAKKVQNFIDEQMKELNIEVTYK